MANNTSQAVDLTAKQAQGRAKTGLKISRYFSRAGVHPYDEVEWELRNASITNEKGKVVFEQANVEIPMLYRDVSGRVRSERARRKLEVVGLQGRATHRPAQLSGGEQQRVAIARALVNDPILLLADEPTGNLDTRTSDEIMGVVQGLHGAGLSIVLVTHEPDIAQYAQRVLSFRDGMLVGDEPVRGRRQARAA